MPSDNSLLSGNLSPVVIFSFPETPTQKKKSPKSEVTTNGSGRLPAEMATPRNVQHSLCIPVALPSPVHAFFGVPHTYAVLFFVTSGAGDLPEDAMQAAGLHQHDADSPLKRNTN